MHHHPDTRSTRQKRRSARLLHIEFIFLALMIPYTIFRLLIG